MPRKHRPDPSPRPFFEGFLSPEEEAAANLIARAQGRDPHALMSDVAVVRLNAALQPPASTGQAGNTKGINTTLEPDRLRIRLDESRNSLIVEGTGSIDFSGAPEAWKGIKLLYRARATAKGEGGIRWLDKDKGKHNKHLAALRAKLDTESPGLGHKLIVNIRGQGVKLACEIIQSSE